MGGNNDIIVASAPPMDDSMPPKYNENDHLLEHAYNPDSSKEHQLANALRSKQYNIARELIPIADLTYDVIGDEGHLIFVAVGGHETPIDIIRTMLDKNPELVNNTSDQDYSLLHSSVYHDSIDVMILLIDRGARLDVRDKSGATPMFYAALERQYAMVSLLFRNGANHKTPDNSGDSPYNMAMDDANLRTIFPAETNNAKCQCIII